ncbi:MAG: hypothetical protein DI535_18170 [Citrobacter freundii]|nr:MAG: hypothetical protein DI535_18170 [Citrobacter freundii]
MKHTPLLPLVLIFALAFSSGCSKNKSPNDPDTPGSGTTKYPATITKTDAAGRITTTYEYNDKKQLISHKREDGVRRDFGTAQIVETVPSLTVTAISTWDFEYKTTQNIYEGGSVGKMLWETTYKFTNGNTRTDKRGIPLFTSTEDGRIESDKTVLYVPDPTKTNYYTYDDKKNLKQIEFFQSTEPSRPFNRLKVTGVDDKPSPFSAVRGYQWLSYPQSYAIDYSFAFCRNNPTQIVIESYDRTSNSYKIAEQNDFTYTYDTDGYPTTVNINTTYYGGTTTRYSGSYTIVYK